MSTRLHCAQSHVVERRGEAKHCGDGGRLHLPSSPVRNTISLATSRRVDPTSPVDQEELAWPSP